MAASGTAFIDATAGAEAIELGAGAATVVAAHGDHIRAGSDASTIIFDSGDVTVDLGLNHGSATLRLLGSAGRDTVTGFTVGQDFITLPSHDRVIAFMNTARPSDEFPSSTLLSLRDGSQLTLASTLMCPEEQSSMRAAARNCSIGPPNRGRLVAELQAHLADADRARFQCVRCIRFGSSMAVLSRIRPRAD